MGRIPLEVIEAVHERADYCCEACGAHLGVDGGQMHHRLARKHGGLDTVINLMEVHMICHTGHRYSIHGAPDRSERLGHIVKRGHDPADKAVTVLHNLLQVHA